MRLSITTGLRFLLIFSLLSLWLSSHSQSTLVDYPFTGETVSPINVPQGISASDFMISSGSVSFGSSHSSTWTGSGVPYAEGNSGWDAPDTASAKYFSFTLTADQTSLIDVTQISFLHRATGAGPSAMTVTVNGTEISTENIPDSDTRQYSESINVSGSETVQIRIIGWDNGSRTTSGGGAFRVDDVVVKGEVTARPQVIDFDNNDFWTPGSGSIASYETDHVYEDLGMIFTGGPALRETSGTQDGFDATFNNSDYAWRLRDNTNVDWTGTLNHEGTIYSFGFQVRRWGASPDFDVSYSINGGTNYTSAGTINDAFLNNSSDWTKFHHELPSPETVEVGDFIVRITANNGNERIMIDDFEYEFDPADQGWCITALDQLFEIDFDQTTAGVNQDAFAGQGFSPLPASGQLHSGAWSQTGMSDGDVNFGDLLNSGDFARGINSGTTTTGGTYAFEVASGNRALGIKPGGSDWTPGTLTLRVLNETGSTINNVSLAYLVYIYNNQNRGNSFDFAYSEDGNSFTDISLLDFESIAPQSSSANWKRNERTAELAGLNWENGEYLYLRWNGADVSGSGSRDAFALDDIRLIAEPAAESLQSITGNYESAAFQTDQSYSVDVSLDRYLRIASGAEVEVQSGSALTVNEGIENDGTLIIGNSASLVQAGAVDMNTGSGIYTVERTGKTDDMEYNGWSSPVPGVAVHNSGVFQNANPCDVYAFDGGEQGWKYDYPVGYTASCMGNSNTFDSDDVISGANGIMTAARGYFAPGEAGATRVFTGNGIHNGNITYTLETGANPGNTAWTDDNWNLIGNPYPSALRITDFLDKNDSTLQTASVYIWDDDGSEGATYEQSDYIVVNSMGTVASTGGAGSSISTGNIASGQGFFVHGSSGGGTVTFNNSMRRGSGNDEFRSGENVFERFWMSVRSEQAQSRILVGFAPDATTGFNKMYDAPKFSGQNALNLSAELETGEEMMILGRPEIMYGDTQVIPLTVVAGDSGTVTFAIDRQEIEDDQLRITLTDTVMKDTVELRTDNMQADLDSAGTFKNRFVLFLHKPREQEEEEPSFVSESLGKHEAIQIYSSANVLVHRSEHSRISSVKIMDMSGRTVYAQSSISSNTLEVGTDHFSPGIYISRVKTGSGGAVSKKVYIGQ